MKEALKRGYLQLSSTAQPYFILSFTASPKILKKFKQSFNIEVTIGIYDKIQWTGQHLESA